jgi:hypothetical protein
MNYYNLQAQQVSSAASQRYLNNNSLTPYQIDLLKTIQTLHYKKFEIENHLLLAQHQFSQTQGQNQTHTQSIYNNFQDPTNSSVTNATNTIAPNDLVDTNLNPNENSNKDEENLIEIVENVELVVDDKNNVDITLDDDTNKNVLILNKTNEVEFTYQNIVNQHKICHDVENKEENKDFSILFKKFCKSCNYKNPNKYCKYIHGNDENYYFYTLPLNKRCLRSVCFDLICLRVHHTLTKRVSIQCDKELCNCKHYVHVNDTSDNKPYFWKCYNESLPKPSYEICKEFFLLKTKEKK